MTQRLLDSSAGSPLREEALGGHLSQLLASPDAPVRDVADAIFAFGWERMTAAMREQDVPAVVLTCMGVLIFRGQVLNGAIRQWAANGHWWRACQTMHALSAVGAVDAAEMLGAALRAFPTSVRHAGAHDAADGLLPDIRVGPRRRSYLRKVERHFDAFAICEPLEELVVAYARRGGLPALLALGG